MATTQPIKSSADIQRVRDVLTRNRDRALFELGLHLAFRGSDLLTLTLSHVDGKVAGDDVSLKEMKTAKSKRGARITTLNQQCVGVLAPLLAERIEQGAKPCDPLFVGARRNAEGEFSRLTTVSLSRLWKDWTTGAGLEAMPGMTYGAHSGRKTKAYILRKEHGMGIEVLMKVLRHSSPEITMRYACVQDEEVKGFHMARI